MLFSKCCTAQGRSLSLCHWDFHKHIDILLAHALCFNVLYHHFLDLCKKLFSKKILCKKTQFGNCILMHMCLQNFDFPYLCDYLGKK